MYAEKDDRMGMFFLLIGVVLIFALLLPAALSGPLAAVAVTTSDHAVEKHGIEADLIRQCLDNNGPFMTMKSKYNPNEFFRLCNLDDGRVGMQALVKENGTWYEKTSFVPKDGSLRRVLDYMRNFATKYKGQLP